MDLLVDWLTNVEVAGVAKGSIEQPIFIVLVHVWNVKVTSDCSPSRYKRKEKIVGNLQSFNFLLPSDLTSFIEKKIQNFDNQLFRQVIIVSREVHQSIV